MTSIVALQGCAAQSEVRNASFTTPVLRETWGRLPKTSAGLARNGTLGPGLDYLLFIPPRRKGKEYRLLLALHGAGDTKEHYFTLWKNEARKHHAILAVPQIKPASALTQKNQDAALYTAFVKDLQRRYAVPPSRTYIAGTSMGGGAATLLIQKAPELWRAGVLISSFGFKACFPGNDLELVNNYTDFPPLLYLHGRQDASLYAGAEEGVRYLQAHGVKAVLQSYENAGHEHRAEWNEAVFAWIENMESDGTFSPSEGR